MDRTVTHHMLVKMLTDGWVAKGVKDDTASWKPVSKVSLSKDGFEATMYVDFTVNDLTNVLMDYADYFKEKLQEVSCTSQEPKENV